MSDELIIFEDEGAVLSVYTGGGIDYVIEQIKKKCEDFRPEIPELLKTEKGRKEIASFAYRVAKSKTMIDNAGAKLTEEWKAKSKKVDTERKKLRDTLDGIKDDIRKPLTEWENEQKAILQKKIDTINEIKSLGMVLFGETSHDIKIKIERIKELSESLNITGDESTSESLIVGKAILVLESSYNLLIESEEMARQNAKLLKEKQEREEKERKEKEEIERVKREENAKKEMEERAKKQAEENARKEIERIEQLKKDAELKALQEVEKAKKLKEENDLREKEQQQKIERLEREKKEAEERQKIEIKRKLEEERKKKEIEELKKKTDKENREKIENEILESLGEMVKSEEVFHNIDFPITGIIRDYIVTGKIKNVLVRY